MKILGDWKMFAPSHQSRVTSYSIYYVVMKYYIFRLYSQFDFSGKVELAEK